MTANRSLHTLASELTREEYIARLLRSAVTPDADPMFPRMPAGTVQEMFVGVQGETALALAASFYRMVTEALGAVAQPLGPLSRVLDFGVGWGRIIRFFSFDVNDDALFGFDVDAEIIGVAQACNVPGTLRTIEPSPPIADMASGSLDVVYAYSVFSHLNESISTQWIAEFSRLLRPGGLAVITTRTREFIQLCARLRHEAQSAHESALSGVFVDTDVVLARYDAGNPVHEPISGGDSRPSSFYGETAIPEAFVKRAWAPLLELVDWHPDPFPGSYQSVAVLRKPLA